MDEEKKAIVDSGERINYGEGKAIREPATGKGRFDLITPFGLSRLARWYELGAMKYSERNWEKGMPFSRYLDSALRHLNKFTMGMDDEDHLAAACWNILAIIHHQEIGQLELDDLPHYMKRTLDSENITDTAAEQEKAKDMITEDLKARLRDAERAKNLRDFATAVLPNQNGIFTQNSPQYLGYVKTMGEYS